MGTAGALEPGFLLREEDTQVVMNSREPSGSEGSGGKSTSCPPQAQESLERSQRWDEESFRAGGRVLPQSSQINGGGLRIKWNMWAV